MSDLENLTLKAKDEEIQIIYQDKLIIPWDEDSNITIDYFVEEFEDDLEIDDGDYLVEIRRIYGTVNIGNPESELSYIAKVDSQFPGWKIKCSRVKRIGGAIFPHHLEINLDNKTILVKFNVYG
jgi:hypothetical protein